MYKVLLQNTFQSSVPLLNAFFGISHSGRMDGFMQVFVALEKRRMSAVQARPSCARYTVFLASTSFNLLTSFLGVRGFCRKFIVLSII